MEFFINKKRQIIQVISALFYNCYISGFKNVNIYKGNLKSFCVPGLNCYSCPGAIGSCPLGALQNSIKGHKISFYIIGIFLLFGVLFGRLVCGFLCPFGFIQELLYKIKTKKINKNKITKKLTYIKYFILIFMCIFGTYIFIMPLFCKYICPQGTLEGGLYFYIFDKNIKNAVGGLFSCKCIVLCIILVGSIFMFRFFCRFMCPLGLIYGFFNKISLCGIRVDEKICTECKKCIINCHMDIKKIGDVECINCGECINICDKKAIFYNYIKINKEKCKIDMEKI